MATDKTTRPPTFKIVVMGDQYCGKTSIIQRYLYGKFSPSYIQTLAGDFLKKAVYANGTQVNLQIFDTAGQDCMKTVIKGLYRNAQGILLVFDFSRKQTLTHIDEWIWLIKSNCEVMPQIILAGNKTDLDESRKNITEKQCEEVAQKHDIRFINISARLNQNIEEGFHSLVKQILRARENANLEYELQNGTIKIEKECLKKTSNCCFG